MDDKITIIEGPTPVFEDVDDGWAIGLNEGPALYNLALARLRTFNGPALVERCHRAWSQNSAMFLHYRNRLGMEEQAPIMAVRTTETDDGHVLLLWVRRQAEETPMEFDTGNDEGEMDE